MSFASNAMSAGLVGTGVFIGAIIGAGATPIVAGAAATVAVGSLWGYTAYRNGKQKTNFELQIKNSNGEKRIWESERGIWGGERMAQRSSVMVVRPSEIPEEVFFAYGTPDKLAKKRNEVKEEAGRQVQYVVERNERNAFLINPFEYNKGKRFEFIYNDKLYNIFASSVEEVDLLVREYSNSHIPKGTEIREIPLPIYMYYVNYLKLDKKLEPVEKGVVTGKDWDGRKVMADIKLDSLAEDGVRVGPISELEAIADYFDINKISKDMPGLLCSKLISIDDSLYFLSIIGNNDRVLEWIAQYADHNMQLRLDAARAKWGNPK